VPPPPPTPVPPGPEACMAAEAAVCPGEAGNGEACFNCVVAHSKQLEDAGCWKESGKGGRHAFIEKWCD
jgi:hypothetical protein